ncbi:MAG: hypothetical protein KTR16_08515 [Acidiferrobacterales bacterium]|nr:hypothetical protein [Acidiferrobacterales bacterium]
MVEKKYISAQSLLEDSFRLADKIYAAGFKPTFILALWRGGAPIGIAVQEYFSSKNIETDHIAVRTSSYTDIDGQDPTVRLYGMNYLIKTVTAEDRFLIVDDVFDTGHTVATLIDDLKIKMRRNIPEQIRIAVPYYKPTRNKVDFEPDFFLHETNAWLKFPHSLEGLSKDEIAKHRPQLYSILQTAKGQ